MVWGEGAGKEGTDPRGWGCTAKHFSTPCAQNIQCNYIIGALMPKLLMKMVTSMGKFSSQLYNRRQICFLLDSSNQGLVVL